MNFTNDELRRIQKTLRKRYKVTRRSNIVDIGFGAALVGGRIFRPRRLTACFFVRRKYTPRKAIHRIPREVSIRFKRANRFVTATLATDVLERRRLELTGRRVVRGTRFVTTGAVVTWTAAAEARRQWGVVTVGHDYSPLGTLSPAQRAVRVQGHGPASFPGTIIGRSSDHSPFDGALIAVGRADLVAHGIVSATESGVKVPRSVEQLARDAGTVGTTRPQQQDLPFRVHALFPTFRLLNRRAALANVLSVIEAPAHAFAPGTSGSMFTLKRQAGAIQVAGVPDAFFDGFGQALVEVLKWAETDLVRHERAVAGSIELVATF